MSTDEITEEVADESTNKAKDVEALLEELIQTSQDPSLKSELTGIRNGSDTLPLPEALISDAESPAAADSGNIHALIKELSIPQKIKLAMFGNQSARSVLIRDTNRQIPFFVLQNSRLTPAEILEYAKNTNIDENVLRAIGNNPTFMRDYATKLGLVSNPKTPIDMSLRWVKFLQDKDLKKLSRSKNIPQIVSTQARKISEKRSATG